MFVSFLGSFAILGKATVNFDMSAHPSVRMEKLPMNSF